MPEVIVKDGKAHMFDETGTPVTVDEQEVGAALESGFRPQTRDEYEQRAIEKERGTIGQQALTALEGGVRGASFGLGTAALAELGGEGYRQAALERAAVNPRTSVVGEVAGAIAPALVSGGAGGVASVARATPAGLAARAGHAVEHGAAAFAKRFGLGAQGAGVASRMASEAIKLGAAGATEGALYGLGSSLADSALEGTEWTAERALAGLEHGLVHGGLGGAAVGAGGVAIGRAGRAVLDKMVGEGKTLRQAVLEFADKRTVKAVVGNDIQTWRAITKNGDDMGAFERVAEKLRARNIVGGTDEDMLRGLELAADDATTKLANVATDLDNAGIKPSAEKLFAQVDDQVKRLREVGTADHARVANRVEAQVAQLRKRLSPSKDVQAVAAKGLENLDFPRANMRDESFARVRAEYESGAPMRPVDVTRYPDGKIALNDGRHRLAVARERGLTHIPAKVRVMDAAGNIVRETDGLIPLQAGAAKTADPSFTELRKFKSGLGEATKWHKASQSMATAEMQKLYGQVARTIDEAADAAGPEVGAMWRKANEDTHDFLTLKDGLELEVLRKAKNRFTSPSDYGMGISSAIATLVTGGGAPAAIVTGLAASVAHKFVRERGSAAIGKLADWVAGTETRMARSASKLAGGKEALAAGNAVRKTGLERLKALGERGRVPTAEARDAPERVKARESLGRKVLRGSLPLLVEGDRTERYQAAISMVRDAQRDPAHLLARVEKTIAPFAAQQPEVAAAMARRVIADYQYLEAQIPATSSDFGAVIGPQKPPPVARADQKKFLSKAEALADPIGVFEDAAAGVINFDAIDAVRDRRPELFDSMRMRVALSVAEAEKPLPHGRRVFLSVAFGLPLDASMVPELPAEEPMAPPIQRPSALDPEAAQAEQTTPAQEAAA